MHSCMALFKKNSPTRSHLEQYTAKVIVQTLGLSRIDYCKSLLIGSTEYQLEKLQRVQNMACRVTYKVTKFNHVTDHLKALHWLKIRERITYKIAILLYKYKYNIAPKCLEELSPSKQHMRPLRSFNTDYIVPSVCRNTLVKNSSLYHQVLEHGTHYQHRSQLHPV